MKAVSQENIQHSMFLSHIYNSPFTVPILIVYSLCYMQYHFQHVFLCHFYHIFLCISITISYSKPLLLLQVKIWFQNRRAKERKQMKKRDELLQKEKLETMQYHAPSAVTSVGPPPMLHASTPMHHPHVSAAHHHLSSKPLMMDIKPVLGLEWHQSAFWGQWPHLWHSECPTSSWTLTLTLPLLWLPQPIMMLPTLV